MMLTILAALAVLSQTPPQPPSPTPPAAQTAVASPLPPQASRALQTQVMLDRAGFSPGEIDASMGSNTRRALAAYQKNGGDPQALPGDPLVSYRITEEDAAGPFTPDIPADLEAQAKLTALGYRNLLEALGERFHASPTLLKKLNRDAKFQAGETIIVPNIVDAGPPVPPARGAKPAAGAQARGAKPAADAPAGGPKSTSDPAAPANLTVTVSRASSSLAITDGSGHVVFFAPVTTGSEHDPLPTGEWKVNGVQRNPTFHYNPDLFWDAEPTKAKATIPAGPNNPVGVVWIDINRPHYGLHGTPEPGMIGKTASHGCVRLTNWDATKVASMVRPGTRVVFAP